MTAAALRDLQRARQRSFVMDYSLLAAVSALLILGLIMVASSSVSVAEKETGEAFYYFYRQLVFVLAGVTLAGFALALPLAVWQRIEPYLLLGGLLLLTLVLIVGREVNGSLRWLALGPVNLQPSELMKLFMILFIAGYLVRRQNEMQTLNGFLKPMALLTLVGILLLLEPDLGAAVVIAATALGMLFLGGVRLWQFGVLFAGLAGLAGLLAYSSPYRVERMTSFINPWADPFDTGFQLTQALIAFGRGEWLGVGLGGSIQKLFYLPFAHTDFLFAVLAEELGLLGVFVVIGLFAYVVYRACVIAQNALARGGHFAGLLAYGLGLSIAMQAFVNIGVNMGILPTKGLTLPLMSYGGSSIVVSCVMCALLLRISHEYPLPVKTAAPGRRR